MENMTLEKELFARIFLHKVAVTGGVLMQDFMDSQQGGAQLPDFIIEKEADKYSDTVIQQAMREGTFEDLYSMSWEKIKHQIPEYLKVV